MANPWPVVRGSEQAEYWFEEQCYITEWLNDPADPGLSIARARVQPGVTTHWHCLDGIAERYVVLSGSGSVQIGDHAPMMVTIGDSAHISPGQRQRITNIGTEDLVFLAICTPRFVPEAYHSLEPATRR